MEKETAKAVINSYNLIPGKIGRKILLAIENNIPILAHDLPEGITLKQIEDLRSLYCKKAKQIPPGKYPRNFIFYHLIKDKISEFHWKIEHDSIDDHARINVEINSPRVKNLRPSLLSLLLDKVDPSQDFLLQRKYKCIDKLPISTLKTISALMEEMEIVYPNERNMQQIVYWLLTGLSGQILTIFSPVCPDYSVEATGNSHCPYRHTFNELGNGLGLIAKRILDVLPVFVKNLNQCGIKTEIIVGLGDFEAFSETNLKRLKITQEEFLNRLSKSKNAFEKACKVSATVYMITDMLGGPKHWLATHQLFADRLLKKDYGASSLSYKKLSEIVRKRKNLYDRWYGKKQLLDHIPQLLTQGAEYAAMGSILSQFDNCLILGADNDAMGPFYSVVVELPTLYLKRFYC